MRAFFLDRDGVITEDVAFKKVDRLKILPNVAAAIKKLNSLGLVIIVTNRPDIARGVFTEDEIIVLHEKMKVELEADGAKINAIYYCPHHPERNHSDITPELLKYRIDCDCRKPKTGMLKQAAKDFKLDFKKCFIIGDSIRDIQAGVNAGIKTIALKAGYEGSNKKFEAVPDFIAADIDEAADLIEMNLKVKALILAGGRGERMRPLTDKIPKPMLSVAGKPIIWHQIELLKKHGITKIVIAGHYLFDIIKKYFGSGEKFGVEIEYSDEAVLMGTGGAIKNAEAFLKDVENFIVLSGDVMAEIDAKKIFQFHKNKKALATLVLRHSDHPYDSDVVKIDSDFRVKKFIGRGQKDLDTAITSIYAFRNDIFNFIPKEFCNIEKDVISRIHDSEDIYGYLTGDYIKDIGTLERYENAKKYYEKQKNVSF